MAGTVAEPGANHLAEMEKIDRHPAHARPGETLKLVFDQAATVDFEQRFGSICAERPHALAKTGSEQDRVH